MTRLSDENLDKLERALAETHRSQQAPVLGPDWTSDVMRDIRQKAGRRRHQRPVTWIDSLVWRTAAVAATLALVFAGSAWVYTDKDTGELTTMLVDDLDTAETLLE